MVRRNLVDLLILGVLLCTNASTGTQVQAHRKNENVLHDIHSTVLEIFEHIKKQDKFQDIKDLLQIDSALKKIEQQNEEIARHLGNNLGRSGMSNTNVLSLEHKLETIEEQLLSNVQGSIRKIGDVERQATEMKSDMDKKLGKMMNVMSSVYEMSQKVTDKLELGKTPNQNSDDDSNVKRDDFITIQFEDLERKIDEKFNHIERHFTKEFSNIEASLSSIYSSCDSLTTELETIKEQCGTSNQVPISRKLNSGVSTSPDEADLQRMTQTIVQNLTRTQREINGQLEKKLQELEDRLVQQQVPSPPTRSPLSNAQRQQSIDVKTNVEKDVEIITPAERAGLKGCRSVAHLPNPKCCAQLYKAGATCDGPYVVYPQGKRAMYAYCDMTNNGGGWTVIMRRGDFGEKSISFDKNWNEYKEGFGNNAGEFWLGNENIHLLTNQEEMVLQVVLQSYDGENVTIEYDPFAIASESQNYRLHVGRVHGNLSYIGSSLRHHNMRPFSTFDKNNEGSKENCAGKFKGGWWYNRCHYALLTGPLFSETESRQNWQGIQWHAWKGQNILKSAEMKIRPKNMI